MDAVTVLQGIPLPVQKFFGPLQIRSATLQGIPLLPQLLLMGRSDRLCGHQRPVNSLIVIAPLHRRHCIRHQPGNGKIAAAGIQWQKYRRCHQLRLGNGHPCIALRNRGGGFGLLISIIKIAQMIPIDRLASLLMLLICAVGIIDRSAHAVSASAAAGKPDAHSQGRDPYSPSLHI